ncbi:hypothetical protein [Eisenibacter elegans]|uniref:hypothetical protein n=1 Tax=Eisenibacter elegans TaxID=997 RepID=UPI00042A1284|nr:hypothetical protein [Eisenibacter elegans]
MYAGTVQEVRNEGYMISYDGYSAAYNETIPFGSKRLRAVGSAALEGVDYIAVERGKTSVRRGNLNTGKTLPLAWAALSSMACFPATRFVEFEGNHVFYWVDLPARSEIFITIKPLTGKRINVYAYSGFDGKTLPPDVGSCVSCEAGYEAWSAAKPPKNFQKSAGEHTIRLNAINNPYRVLIGVAGAKDVVEGDYELNISLK